MTLNTDTVEIAREPPVVQIRTSDHKVVITVEVKSQAMADAYLDSVELLTQAFCAQMAPIPAETISSIVSMIVPKAPVPSTLLREARMLAQAKTEILQSHDWVTAHEIAHLAHFSASNPSSQPNKWKQAGKIFALRHEGVDYFPIYGLDPGQGFRPFSAMESVISTFDSMKDAWAIAFWFATANTFLGGKRPKEALPTNPAGVLSAAQEEVSGVVHG